MHYILFEVKDGWRLKVYGVGSTTLIYEVNVKKKHEATRILQWLRLHLKPEDKLTAA